MYFQLKVALSTDENVVLVDNFLSLKRLYAVGEFYRLAEKEIRELRALGVNGRLDVQRCSGMPRFVLDEGTAFNMSDDGTWRHCGDSYARHETLRNVVIGTLRYHEERLEREIVGMTAAVNVNREAQQAKRDVLKALDNPTAQE